MSENQIFNKSLNKGNNILYQEIDRYVFSYELSYHLYAGVTEKFNSPKKWLPSRNKLVNSDSPPQNKLVNKDSLE